MQCSTVDLSTLIKPKWWMWPLFWIKKGDWHEANTGKAGLYLNIRVSRCFGKNYVTKQKYLTSPQYWNDEIRNAIPGWKELMETKTLTYKKEDLC